MAVDPDKLQIIAYPDPVLRQKAKPIPSINDEVRTVAERMIQLMHQARGVGLAGPQVGLSWRLFVANPTGEPGEDRVYINPEISEPGSETDHHEEGCLSLPNIHAEITRPTAVRLRARDEQNNPVDLIGEGFPARVWQHEYDHLDGVLILDRMGAMDQRANKRAIRELENA